MLPSKSVAAAIGYYKTDGCQHTGGTPEGGSSPARAARIFRRPFRCISSWANAVPIELRGLDASEVAESYMDASRQVALAGPQSMAWRTRALAPMRVVWCFLVLVCVRTQCVPTYRVWPATRVVAKIYFYNPVAVRTLDVVVNWRCGRGATRKTLKTVKGDVER